MPREGTVAITLTGLDGATVWRRVGTKGRGTHVLRSGEFHVPSGAYIAVVVIPGSCARRVVYLPK